MTDIDDDDDDEDNDDLGVNVGSVLCINRLNRFLLCS